MNMEFEQQPTPQDEQPTVASVCEEPQSLTFDEVLTVESTAAPEPAPAAQAMPEAQIVAESEAPAKEMYEYVEEFQRDGILNKYRRAYQKGLRRLGVLCALTLLALLYECLPDAAMPAFLSPVLHPVRHILVNDLLWIVGLACIADSFVKGAKALFSSKPEPQSLLGLLVTVTVLYQGIALIGRSVRDVAPSPIQPAALFLLFFCIGTVLLEIMELRREVFAFAQMSAEGEKTVLCATTVQGSYATAKTKFFSDFYRNGQRYPTRHRCIYWYFGGLLAIWLVFFFLYLGRVGAWDGLRCAYVSLMMATPTSLVILFAFPQFRLARALYQKDAMVLSEQTTEVLAQAQNVVLGDGAVLDESGVHVSDLRIYGNYPIDRALYYLGSALAGLDCVMARSFCHGIREMGHSQTCRLTERAQNGICATVDEKVLVEFGTAAFLQKKQYGVPQTEPQALPYAQAYLAIDSQIVATMRVNYALRADFTERLLRCGRQGLSVTVRSGDPLLTELILQSLLPQDKVCGKLLLQKATEPPAVHERLGAIASTTSSDELVLLDTVLASNDIYLSTKKHQFTACVFMILSLFGMAALQNRCIDGALHAAVLVPVLYQLLCNLGMGLLLWLDEKKERK